MLPGMADTSPIPVRLTRAMIARLDTAADKICTTRANIIRFCVESWLTHFERRGKAVLPPDWEEITSAMDGRRRPDGAAVHYPAPRGSLELNEEAGKPVSAGRKGP